MPDGPTENPDLDLDSWRSAVEGALRGRSFEHELVHVTRDGLDIQPLYTTRDRVDVGHGSERGAIDPQRLSWGWDVRQAHRLGDSLDDSALDRCRADILDDLGNGVTSVELVGVDQLDASGFSRLLSGVGHGVVSLAPHGSLSALEAFGGHLESAAASPAPEVVLGLDPIGEWSRSGRIDAENLDAALDVAAEWPAGVRCLVVDTVGYSEAGATEVQTLAWGLSTAVRYLRGLVERGLEPAQAGQRIAFRRAAEADQFLTIATLRAARRTWARVLAASGVESPSPAYQQVVTSASMYSRRDPRVNMVRATVATLAAGLGGADSITVHPFDLFAGGPTDQSRRLARNTHHVLVREAHLARTTDPAGGSWFVESLTDRLAVTAWAEFQRLEGAGGIEPALTDGSVRRHIDASWQARLDSLGHRREVVTGVSDHPSIDEPAELGGPAEPVAGAGLPLRRLAAPFEALRDAADRHLIGTSKRPAVHLATLGTEAQHRPRSGWAQRLLAVGGIAAPGAGGDGAMSPIEAEARFVDAHESLGVSIAVVCGDDTVLAERGAATIVALRSAGAQMVAVVGAAGESHQTLVDAGADAVWHDETDVLALLGDLHVRLGVS